MEAKKLGIKRIIIPKQNEIEASIVEGIEILAVNKLEEVVNYLNGNYTIKETIRKNSKPKKDIAYEVDFSEVKGQKSVKRALEVAASGGHNCLLIRYTWFWKNHVSKTTFYHFTRYENRGNFRSY